MTVTMGAARFVRRHRLGITLFYIVVMVTVSVMLQLFVGSNLHDWIFE